MGKRLLLGGGAQARSAGEGVRFEQVLLVAVEEVEGAVVELTEQQRHLQGLVKSAVQGGVLHRQPSL